VRLQWPPYDLFSSRTLPSGHQTWFAGKSPIDHW
jgi:hypothetical protein